jgi:hypothetical protein
MKSTIHFFNVIGNLIGCRKPIGTDPRRSNMLRVQFAVLAAGMIPMVLAESGFAQREQAAGLVFTPPPGWKRVQELQHTSLIAPEGQASVTFFPEEPFTGTAQQRHDEVWAQIVRSAKFMMPPPRQREKTGEFLETCAFFRMADLNSDASPSEQLQAIPYICLYTVVKDGLAYTVRLYALNDIPWATNVTAVRAMVASMSPARRDTSTSTTRPTSAITPNVPINTLAAGASTQTLPDLNYEPPRNFYRGASHDPDQFSSNEVNASVQVYPFRKVPADVQRQFRQNLLRDWIDPQFREQNVAAPVLTNGSIPGAQEVVFAQFTEFLAGSPALRMRVLIVAGGAAALMDVSANSAYSWQRIDPAIRAMIASTRVTAGAKTPASEGKLINPGPAGRAMAGLYMAITYHPRAFNTSDLAAYYYLFSAEGRVYRKYDELTVPGGDPSRFDFDAAQRADAVNSGFYSVNGNQLRIQMGSQGREVIATTVEGGHFKIGGDVYDRQ